MSDLEVLFGIALESYLDDPHRPFELANFYACTRNIRDSLGEGPEEFERWAAAEDLMTAMRARDLPEVRRLAEILVKGPTRGSSA